MNFERDLGWWALYCLCGLIFIGLVINNSGMQAVACSPAEQNCLRDWVSALGGWAAVGAAIPTIVYLSKQIAASDRHHRDIVELETRRTLALIRQVLRRLEAIDDRCATLQQTWQHLDDTNYLPSAAHNLFSSNLEELRLRVDSDLFVRFEDEVEALQEYSVQEAFPALETYELLELASDGHESVETYRGVIGEIIDEIQHFAETFRTVALSQQERLEQMAAAKD